MKITQKDLMRLEKIKALFEEADNLYNEFSNELKEEFHNMHNEEGSIDYCIRWGLTASEDLVEEYSNGTKSLLVEFSEYCHKKSTELANKYNDKHTDVCLVYDGTWDTDNVDSNMYSYAAMFLIDEYPEWFEDCESIEECDKVLREKHGDTPFNDYLEDEKDTLSYGAGDLNGAVIIEVGTIGRWNGKRSGLDICDVNTIGELLTSSCEQFIFYVDKETGEFHKDECHHDGRNSFVYRELTCSRGKFEELLEESKSGELDSLVEKYSKPIGPRIADVYGWDLDFEKKVHSSLEDKISDAKEICEGNVSERSYSLGNDFER